MSRTRACARDGTVEVNRRSPTHYLNGERYGGTPVPTSADPKAPPQWQTVSRTGRFEWHDHPHPLDVEGHRATPGQ